MRNSYGTRLKEKETLKKFEIIPARYVFFASAVISVYFDDGLWKKLQKQIFLHEMILVPSHFKSYQIFLYLHIIKVRLGLFLKIAHQTGNCLGQMEPFLINKVMEQRQHDFKITLGNLCQKYTFFEQIKINLATLLHIVWKIEESF